MRLTPSRERPSRWASPELRIDGCTEEPGSRASHGGGGARGGRTRTDLQEAMRPHSHPHLFEVLVDLMGAFHHRSREDHADVVIGEATERPSIVADDGEIRQDLCRIAQRCG